MSRTNVVLIGMPGAGKSTIGILLARALGRHFLDTDVFIQAATGRSLHKLIETYSMDGFCKIEQEYVQGIQIENAVIATGGSVVYYESAMNNLKKIGIVVYLKLPVGTLTRRIQDYSGRGVVMDSTKTFDVLYEERTPLYDQYADTTVDLTDLSHEQSVEKIITTLSDIIDINKQT